MTLRMKGMKLKISQQAKVCSCRSHSKAIRIEAGGKVYDAEMEEFDATLKEGDPVIVIAFNGLGKPLIRKVLISAKGDLQESLSEL